MSLDYPFYEELRRRRHRGAWWWLVGDRLYYLGLFSAVFAVACVAVGLGSGLLGFGWRRFVFAAITFPVTVFVFLVGVSLKTHAYTLAERDGISADEVYQRGATPQASGSDPAAKSDHTE